MVVGAARNNPRAYFHEMVRSAVVLLPGLLFCDARESVPPDAAARVRMNAVIVSTTSPRQGSQELGGRLDARCVVAHYIS